MGLENWRRTIAGQNKKRRLVRVDLVSRTRSAAARQSNNACSERDPVRPKQYQEASLKCALGLLPSGERLDQVGASCRTFSVREGAF